MRALFLFILLLMMTACEKEQLGTIQLTEYYCQPTEDMNLPRLEQHFSDQGMTLIDIISGTQDQCKACFSCRTGRVFILEE